MNMYQQFPYGYGYQRMAPTQIDQGAQPAPIINYIKGRPVVSIDEARASQIDLDGSLYVFPDLGNKKIYTKQINMDGTASFNIFELVVQNEEAPTQPYVTRAELDEILAQFKNSLPQTRATESGPARQKTQINL